MHTVVITESERDRRYTNEINKAVRRCVIGKVKRKLPSLSDDMQNAFRGALWPHLDTPLPVQTMPKCGCKPGTVCMNVACPHRLIATCITSGGYVPVTSSGDVPLVPAQGVMM